MKKIILALMALPLSLSAADKAVKTESIQVDTEQAAEDQLDPEHQLAILALDRMARYLRSLDRFRVWGTVSRDFVLTNGQKIQLDKSVSLLADPPSKLRMRVSDAYGEQHYFYDGKQFTIYLTGLGYYASFDAPDTLGETIMEAKEKHDVDFPLADLFFWGTEYADFDLIEEASVIGLGQVNGVSCNHFAYRQAEVDWQVCIQRGDQPVPLKLVITTKTEAEQPQYQAVMQWDTRPLTYNAQFSFSPKQSDQRIRFNDRTMQAQQSGGQ